VAISITHSPKLVEEQTLPLLFSSLPDRAPSKDDTLARHVYRKTLSQLQVICHQAELFETLVIRVLARLDLLCSAANDLPTEDLEATAAYAHSLLHSIAQVLVIKLDEHHPDVPKHIERLVPCLFNLFIASSFSDKEAGQLAASEPRLISVAGRIITMVIQSVPTQ
jgi:DNA repair/transcription protein MET18/MMS19